MIYCACLYLVMTWSVLVKDLLLLFVNVEFDLVKIYT